jgi:drug/metabolite transporter (DMT)-like permease
MVFELTANFFAGLYGSLQVYWIFVLALFLYGVANFFWLHALRNGSGLARGSIYYTILSLVGTIILAVAVYQETITLIKLVGIFIGFVSLALLYKE